MYLPPLVQIRENLEFHHLIQRDKSNWPRCLLWHGWLPSLDSNGDWAVGAGGAAARVLEASSGGYSPHVLEAWVDSEEFESETTSGQPNANLDVWTDGSLVRDDLTGACCGGCGVFAATSGSAWFQRSWGRLDLLPPHVEFGSECCRLSFSPVGPVQSVQRAELWGVLLALQAARPVHLGVVFLLVVSLCGPFKFCLMGIFFCSFNCLFLLGGGFHGYF